jgi:hypothetical protein
MESLDEDLRSPFWTISDMAIMAAFLQIDAI